MNAAIGHDFHCLVGEQQICLVTAAERRARTPALGRVADAVTPDNESRKAALAHLVAVCRRNSLAVIDCQLPSRHLTTLGSRTIPRSQFQALLREHARTPSAALAAP